MPEMKVLVTGSAGLIGRWVSAQLAADGHTVGGLDVVRQPPGFGQVTHFVQCDILDRDALLSAVQAFSPNMLVHLAARVDLEEKHDLQGYAANIDGVRNVIAAVSATPSITRAIYTSSQLVCRVGHVPRSDTEYCPSTLYGQSKVLTERIVRKEGGGGVTWCLVRPTTVWGPHMSPHYQKLLRLIQRRLFFHSGSAALSKSYAYAGNIAYQYRQMLSAAPGAIHGKSFYLCDYEPLSLRDYANALARELHAPPIPTIPVALARTLAWAGDGLNAAGLRRFPFNSFRLNNILTEYVFDVRDTQQVCGPLPYTFEQGVRETARWFKEQEANAAVPR